MGTTNARGIVFTAHAKSLICIKARQLCRRQEFNSWEQEDIQQDLWLRLVTKAHHFDSTRGSLQTFVEQVVGSGVCVILRQRRRQQRLPWFYALSLQTTMVESDGASMPLERALSTDYLRRHLGTVSTNYLERQEDAIDLKHVLGSLSPGLRILCQQLSNGSAYSAACNLGASRRQLRGAMRVIRLHLERAGFEIFQKKRTTLPVTGVLRI